MADSQLILELLFLQRRGGCSLTVLLFFLYSYGVPTSIRNGSRLENCFKNIITNYYMLIISCTVIIIVIDTSV